MQGVPGIWVVVVGLVDIVENMDTFEGYCVRVLKKMTSGPLRHYIVGTVDRTWTLDMYQL